MTEVPLRRLASVSYGLGQPPPLADSGVPIIRATNIERGRVVPRGLIFAAIEDLPLERAPLLRADEVLVVRSGAYTGDSALITGDWAGAAPGYDLRVTPGLEANPRFIAYSLLGRRALEAMWIASSRAAQPHLNAEELGDVPITRISLPAQRMIADFLDTETARIDALIAKKRRLVELTADRFRSWRETVLVPDVGVEWTPLQRLTDPTRPIVYGIVQAGPEYPGGIPYIKTGDVANLVPEQLSHTSPEIDRLYTRARVRPGDIVMAMRASIGLPVIVPPDLPVANLTQGTARIAPKPGVDGMWLFHALQTNALKGQCDAHAVGTTFRTLNIWDLRRLRVPVPLDAGGVPTLGRRVADAAGKADQLVASLARQVSLLQEHRQALITAAVTGQIEVPGLVA